MTPSPADHPWSVRVSVHDVPETGRHFELEADEAVRAAIAKTAGLRELPRLHAAFDVTRRGRDGLRVAGRVAATVGQNCIVSLDPMDSDIDEPIELDFAPPQAGDLASAALVDADLTEHDPPEPLIGGTVDLGAIASEFLLLAIDPYPRKPDAVFEPPAVEDDTGHPFAALAALKKQQSGRDG